MPQPNWTTWWDHSCSSDIPWLSAPHCLQQFQSGACSTSTAQPLSPCHSHRSRTAQRHQATQLSISEFPQLCFTKHPFPRTVPLQLHEDFREAQTPSNTGNPREVTFADAGMQLSFAEFLECCNLSRALPLRHQPSSTLLQDASTQASPHSAAFTDATTQLPLTEFFLGCVYSNDSLDRPPTLPSQGNLRGAPLHHPKHMDATLSISSINGGDFRTPVPRAQLNGTPPPPPSLEVQLPMSSPHEHIKCT